MALFGKSIGRSSALLSLLFMLIGIQAARADFAGDLALAAEDRAKHNVVTPAMFGSTIQTAMCQQIQGFVPMS